MTPFASVNIAVHNIAHTEARNEERKEINTLSWVLYFGINPSCSMILDADRPYFS